MNLFSLASKTVLAIALSSFSFAALAEKSCHDLLDYSATKLRTTEQVNFCDAFAGKALLVVNTASRCGFTPQFEDLEKLHKQHGDKLAIVGFPSNDFNQEHSDSEKIGAVCYANYGVTFTMLEPSSVKGEDANSVFKKLAERTGKEPAWNFNKYLISADGESVEHFESGTKPSDQEFVSKVLSAAGE